MRTAAFVPALVVAAATTAQAQCIVMGGHDAARGGLVSLAEGGLLTQLRSAIFDEFAVPVVLTAAPELTTSYLDGVDVLFLSSVFNAGPPGMVPLSQAEQEALRAFVLRGGRALIFVDGDGFEAANESLLDPFGLDAAGTTAWPELVTVPNPTGHPITKGRFGEVSSFTIALGGWFDSLGPYATMLGRLPNGAAALAVIPAGAMGPTSGPVVLFSDSSITFDIYELFEDHRTIILNAVSFVFGPQQAPCYPDCDRTPGCPTLDIFDFLCFQNRFAAQDPYACDCDAAQGLGVCDVFDFLCFQNRYAAGCP